MELIDALSEVGLGWLAFELVDGVRRGIEPVESPDTLSIVRKRIRDGVAEVVEPQPEAREESDQLTGDRQLIWAAEYVQARIEQSLMAAKASLKLFDQVVDGDADLETGKTIRLMMRTSLVMQDERVEQIVNRLQVSQAMRQLGPLREALSKWIPKSEPEASQ